MTFTLPGAAAATTLTRVRAANPDIRGKGFANALSVVVKPNGLAGLRYFSAGSKANHVNIPTAATNTQLQRALLDGLNYADVHPYASSLTEEYANKTRRGAWRDEVANLLAAPPAWIDAVTTSLAPHVNTALLQVK